jgi:hypothetical protein
MGEFSKMIGDIGEDIVAHILGLMGWTSINRNIPIDCCTVSHEAKTHGLDGLYLYESPLESNCVENVIISSKYSSRPYSSVPSTFKSHLTDLAHTIECYSKSPLKREYNAAFARSMRKNDTGVLFYFNNDTTPENQDVISKIYKSRIDNNLKFKVIHVIDNKKATFLFDSLTHLKMKHENKIFFYHPSTALNITSKDKKYYSQIMPVEFISSPIIPIIIPADANQQPTLCLVTSEALNDESLELLINVARDISHDLTRNITLLFPSFNQITHKPLVDRANMARTNDNIQLNITINTYNETYASQV